MEIELLDVGRLAKTHTVEHHDDAVPHRQKIAIEVAHRTGRPRLAAADAVRRGEVGLHVPEIRSTIAREDVVGSPGTLTADIVDAGKQVIPEVVDEQRVASPR